MLEIAPLTVLIIWDSLRKESVPGAPPFPVGGGGTAVHLRTTLINLRVNVETPS